MQLKKINRYVFSFIKTNSFSVKLRKLKLAWLESEKIEEYSDEKNTKI